MCQHEKGIFVGEQEKVEQKVRCLSIFWGGSGKGGQCVNGFQGCESRPDEKVEYLWMFCRHGHKRSQKR